MTTPDRVDGQRSPGLARSWSVKADLNATLWSLIVIITVMGLAGIISLRSYASASARIADGTDPMLEANARALQAITDGETGVRGYLISGDDRFLDVYRSGRENYPAAIRSLRELAAGDSTIEGLITSMDEVGRSWFGEFAKPILEQYPTDATGATSRAQRGEGKVYTDRFRQRGVILGDALTKQRTDLTARSGLIVSGATAVLALLLLAALAAGVALTRRTRHRIIGPLEAMQPVLERLTRGDFSARADESTGAEELRETAVVVNRVAAESERLTALQRRRLEKEQTIRDVSRTIREYLDADAVMRLAALELGQALGADRAIIRSIGEDGSAKVVTEWNREGSASKPADESIPLPLPLRDAVAAAFQIGQYVQLDDVETDDRLDPATRQYLRTQGVRSALLAPVYAADAVVVMIALHMTSEPRTWSETDRGVVESVAREVGVALSHAALYEREQLAVAKLEELDAAKTAFVSTVSHELRTPLSSIVGYAEILRDGDAGQLSETQDKMVEVIERNTSRLLLLIDDLLTVSRLESGTFSLDLGDVDVGMLIEGSIEALAPNAVEAGVTVTSHVSAGLPHLSGDGQQLERVLLNLLSNSIKFTASGGSVSVRANPHPRGIEVKVIDTGLGIPPEEMDRLFTRFFRSSVSHEREVPGTGLGLAIVKSIVEAHGGSIDLESVLGEGTAVRFTIPLALSGPLARPAFDLGQTR
ncbi:MAG: ATP-binding protein [Aquihabitans sp.]